MMTTQEKALALFTWKSAIPAPSGHSGGETGEIKGETMGGPIFGRPQPRLHEPVIAQLSWHNHKAPQRRESMLLLRNSLFSRRQHG
ncbi:hypothetical protein J0B02_15410 [Enterobacteriaceae bacterium YMB-R22]|jgi:hypothetical protein|uniref:hypothetical protein n=1 Tax=Tenebrionicola larvae TaxID=2815733 RepID=UPI0020125ABB|nr:hypothetical protein [Tenebrionicola larvae]MBV4414185.1 hypothetical protein [Tenebrionicola larvae]